MTGSNNAGSGGTSTSGAAPAQALEPLASAMKRLGIGKTTIYKLAHEGKLRMGKVVGVNKTVVARDDVDALIAQALEAGA